MNCLLTSPLADLLNFMIYYLGQKKKKEPSRRFVGEKNTVRSCDIMLDHERSAQGKVIRDCPRLLPSADRA